VGTERVFADWVQPGGSPLHLTLDFGDDGHYQIDAMLIA
jgi:hypothetical protein